MKITLRISIPYTAKDPECVVKDFQLGEAGQLFKHKNKTYKLTNVIALQAMQASKLWRDCGFSNVNDWKENQMRHKNFSPKPMEIVYAHYFEEV